MAAKTTVWTPDRRPKVEEALRSSSTRAEAARALGCSAAALDHACRVFGLQAHDLLGRGGETVTVHLPPPPGLTKAELVEHLKTRYARRSAHEDGLRLVPVTISDSMPIGLLPFGDLHLDDPGCNVPLVEEHARLVRDTPGLWGMTPGDFLNAWVGRLQRLYATQNVTVSEGWALVEWFFELARDWLVAVLGNHDVWTGPGSPVEWIARGAGVWSEKHDVRLALRFSNGREVRIHLRHDFPGRSIYNDAHGPLRAAMFGHRDHLKIAGHTHVSAYHVAPDPSSGIAMHLLRVAGYKEHDEHPRELGLLEKRLGPSACIVIDPELPDTHPDLVHVFRDPREGAEFLRFKRGRRRPVAARR